MRILLQPKKYLIKKIQINLSENKTLLETITSEGFNLTSMCGGRGTCGKCKIIILRSHRNINNVSRTEKTLLSKEEIIAGYRLSCLTRALKPATVEICIPPESEETQQRLMVSGLTPPVKLKPATQKVYFELKHPTLKDTTADLERLTQTLFKNEKIKIRNIGFDTLKKLPDLLRAQEWKITLSIFGAKEIIKVEQGNKTDRCYGFALDIGTTKLAGYLVDLRTGKIASTVSSLNPQSKFGSDVISRITYSMSSPESMKVLTKCIIDEVNRLIYVACENVGITTEDIIDFSVAGNTAMHHIFLGITPRYLSLSPYPAALTRSMEIRASDLCLKTAPDCRVYIFPVVAGFVGGDAIADIVATKIHSAKEMSMLIDIGTNAEIIIGDKSELLSCSCASGPAFEGAQIKYGMRASEGAIEKIWIEPKTHNISYRVIGRTKPVGICGSAIVECIAEMLRTGILDSRGRIQGNVDNPRIRETDGVKEMVIAYKKDTGIDTDISITQSDVREIQLAKAAVYTGISILMKHMRVKPKEIKKVFLAGAFGTYIDPSSARDIGMFPEIPLERFEFVGNTAGSGARMALVSSPIRVLAEKIHKSIQYIELGADPEFQKEFVSAIDLPHARKELFPTITKIIKHNQAIFRTNERPGSKIDFNE